MTVVNVQWFGSDAVDLTYKDPGGKPGSVLLYRHDEPKLQVAEQGRPWNTSVASMVEAGILESKHGRARLLKPSELPKDWDPTTDARLTVWEMVHYLIRVLEAEGESGAAALARKLGAKAEVAREPCYRLCTLCVREKRSAEALSYNNLVQGWPEIMRLAQKTEAPPQQRTMFSPGTEG